MKNEKIKMKEMKNQKLEIKNDIKKGRLRKAKKRIQLICTKQLQILMKPEENAEKKLYKRSKSCTKQKVRKQKEIRTEVNNLVSFWLLISGFLISENQRYRKGTLKFFTGQHALQNNAGIIYYFQLFLRVNKKNRWVYDFFFGQGWSGFAGAF